MTEFSAMSDNQRRNFRVPVQMDSFVYPADGSWQGRRRIQTVDLSCSGISFCAGQGLEIGDIVEVVLPMTADPLIVPAELLRKETLTENRICYAAKFIELQPEAEQMICQAVFGIQRQEWLNRSNRGEMEV